MQKARRRPARHARKSSRRRSLPPPCAPARPRRMAPWRSSSSTRRERQARRQPVTQLNWSWIALMATVPGMLGAGLAYPCWRKTEVILGNLAGTAVILGFAFALIFRESAEVDRLTRACLDQGYTCWPIPSAFVRYAIYASIGFLE